MAWITPSVGTYVYFELIASNGRVASADGARCAISSIVSGVWLRLMKVCIVLLSFLRRLGRRSVIGERMSDRIDAENCPAIAAAPRNRKFLFRWTEIGEAVLHKNAGVVRVEVGAVDADDDPALADDAAKQDQLSAIVSVQDLPFCRDSCDRVCPLRARHRDLSARLPDQRWLTFS
jgi:hypothetical protein